MAQAFRDDNTFATFQQEIALIGLKQDFAFQHDEGFVFVVVRMLAFEFALELHQANGEIIHAGQIDRRIGLRDLVPDLPNRKELNWHCIVLLVHN